MILTFKTLRGDISEIPCESLISVDGVPFRQTCNETIEGLSVRLTALELLVSQIVDLIPSDLET